jgi:dihydroorotate dehydrogenase electron transfer subunit
VRSRPVSIIEMRSETPTQCTMVLDWRSEAQPGQFVMVWLPGVDEIPMGFSTIGPSASITIQRMGDATRALCALEQGERVGVRGPFGKGFQLLEGKRCLLVGGGNGVAPLVPLAEALVANGCRVYSAVGARTREELLFIDRLAGISGIPPEVATDDGSEGHHGFVSNLAERLMNEFRPDMVFTCGPELMMRKVADTCWDMSIPFQASMERYMKCGIGLCDACACGGYLVCRDGPVLSGEQLREVPDFGHFKRGPSGEKVPFAAPDTSGSIGVKFRTEK